MIFVKTALLLIAFACAWAQSPTATLIGVVQDPSGLAVVNAAITVHNADTGIDSRARTGADGTFTMPNLNSGTYHVTIEKEGFQSLRETGIRLQVQQSARIEFNLQVGTISQVVQVSAETPLVNTENATRGAVVDNSEITQMPLLGRNFNDLALLSPGITSGPQQVGGAGMSANGTRPDNVNLLIDGVQTRDIAGGNVLGVDSANLESVQEFRIMTNNYSSEYGQVAGGIITLAMKSGTNLLHGSAFEYARNSVFDARNFFAASKGDLSLHQFGGAFDGPVYIPKIFDGRNKTFFLVSIEQSRQVTPQSGLITVPTALERIGNFTQTTTAAGAPVTLKDPLNGNALFPGATIPASRLSPISQKVVPFWPELNRTGRVNNYAFGVSTFQNTGKVSVKIDENLTPRDRLSVKIAMMGTDYNSLGGNTAPQFLQPKHRKWPVPGATYTRNLTSTMILETRFGLSRALQQVGSQFLGQSMAEQLGIPGTSLNPSVAAFPLFNVSGFAQVGDPASNPNWSVTENYQSSSTLTWVKGRHLLKAGGEADRARASNLATNNANGNFPFLGNLTGVAFADFQLGMPDSSSRLLNPNVVYMRKNSYFFFGQDDFKINSRLTLNLGLRYELNLPPTEKYGRWSNFIPDKNVIAISSDSAIPNLAQQLATVNLTGKVQLAKDLNLPDSLVHADKNGWAPRIGLAWRPFGGNRTSVRGGWGMFYGQDYLAPYYTYMGGMYPFQLSQTFSRLTTDPTLLTLANPFPATRASFGGTTSISGIQLDMKMPRVQNYNLTIEHQLDSQTAIEVAYSGSIGRRLSRAWDINQPYYYQPQLWGPNNSIPRPYTGWGTVTYVSYGSLSNYNAALFSLRRRMGRGVMFRFNYTYSKALDEASSYQASAPGGFRGVQDARNPSLEYGRADFDARHVYSFNFTYQSPLHSVVGRGWQLAGTGRGSSGFPITPATSAANQALGQAPRPDRVCNGGLTSVSPQRWFDTSCFTTVPSGAFRPGNSGRGILDGPGFQTINLSLSRTFKFAERQSLQFRFEAFNVRNHANFFPPNLNVNLAAGGTIVTADSPRAIQFAVRYQF